ncbi:MAG: hypothetical protein ABJL99_11435 [Aliishimia sp.]
MNEAEAVLMFVRIWAMVGAVVAAVFLTIGMDRIDEDAQDAYVFRPLLIPGILVIWPLVLWRWYRLETDSDAWQRRYEPPRKAHFVVGWVLPIGICIIILIGLSLRQTWPSHIAPQMLSAPVEAES